MNIFDIIGGALLLTLGRKIFWFFVGAIGFYIGLQLATQYLHIQPAWLNLLIALGVGLIGALLAIFFQRALIGVAGFLAGVLITSGLLSLFALQAKGWEWLVILIGGIIGVIFISVLFDWALVILSSLAGTVLIVQGFNLAGTLALGVGVVLFVAGVVFQKRLNRRPVPAENTSANP